jgi:hypothetical protein
MHKRQTHRTEEPMTAPTQTRENDLEKLRELVKDIDFCMLTTVDDSGDLHSRSLVTGKEPDLGENKKIDL